MITEKKLAEILTIEEIEKEGYQYDFQMPITYQINQLYSKIKIPRKLLIKLKVIENEIKKVANSIKSTSIKKLK